MDKGITGDCKTCQPCTGCPIGPGNVECDACEPCLISSRCGICGATLHKCEETEEGEAGIQHKGCA